MGQLLLPAQKYSMSTHKRNNLFSAVIAANSSGIHFLAIHLNK